MRGLSPVGASRHAFCMSRFYFAFSGITDMMLNRVARVGLLGGIAAIAACTSVRPISPRVYLEDNAPPVVWVTYHNNTLVPVAEPEVRRDTLRGTLEGARVKIPLADSQTVQAKVREGEKTVLFLSGVGVAAISTLYVALISQAGSSGGQGIICPVDKRGRNEGYC